MALTNTAFEGMIGRFTVDVRNAVYGVLTSTFMPSTSSARPATFSSTQLHALRARVNGGVFVPGDDGYDTARQTWNVTTFDQRPAIVVMPSIPRTWRPRSSFAREHNLSIAAQGGGHGHPRPANDALLVNFASMTSVRIMPGAAPSDSSERSGAAGTAQAEAGAKWHDVIAAAHPHGLAPLNGFAGTVGVSGYMLGGGIGWLARQYGAAAGSLRSAELVTADGRLLQVNDHSHADLFWGLRGGGGNFGIVTSFEFDLYPVKEIFGGFVAYPLAQGKQALSAYAQWTKTVPDTLTSAVRLVHYPPAPAIPEPLRGASAIVIMACCTGSTAEGEALVSRCGRSAHRCSIRSGRCHTLRSGPSPTIRRMRLRSSRSSMAAACATCRPTSSMRCCASPAIGPQASSWSKRGMPAAPLHVSPKTRCRSASDRRGSFPRLPRHLRRKCWKAPDDRSPRCSRR